MERAEYVEKMAENMPTLRTKLNMSQSDLANLIGVSRITVAFFETKKRKMTWNTFLSLILVFSKNSEANKILTALDIYNDELEQILKGN